MRRQAIVGGTVDPGDPAMMEMFGVAGTKVTRCTVTLVTPRVVLTAAHCLRDAGSQAKFGIFPGSDDRQVTGKDLLPTTAAAYDPAYPNDPNDGHDIGNHRAGRAPEDRSRADQPDAAHQRRG
jgi:V8-like Glu-specific endopeptidase